MLKKIQYTSQYEVRFDYQKDDGYWNCSAKEWVFVPYDIETENEKDLHDRAAEIIIKKYKNAKVYSVIYC